MPSLPSPHLTAGLAYVRDHYRVPAAALIRVEVNGRPGTIAGAAGHLAVDFVSPRERGAAHPTWQIQYLPADEATAEFLTDVEARKVYHVDQRTSKYAMNSRTGRHCTRQAKKCLSFGLVERSEYGHGHGDYMLTDEGGATLAAHRQLVADGPYTPPNPGGRTLSASPEGAA